jgi:hypothetical protein
MLVGHVNITVIRRYPMEETLTEFFKMNHADWTRYDYYGGRVLQSKFGSVSRLVNE